MANDPTARAAMARLANGVSDDSCELYRNGSGPHSGHCNECDQRLYLIARSRMRSEFRVRDVDGRILTGNWLL